MPYNLLSQLRTRLALQVQAHVYYIHAALLANNNTQKWTNLGLWEKDHHIDYVVAAYQLAHHMGQSLALTPQQKVLDIGCGYGASIQVWRDDFAIQNMSVLEMQPICCHYLKQHYASILMNIYQQSIFSARPLKYQQRYDVVISIDAAYHSSLQCYLDAISPWLAEKAKIGFHVLIKSERWQDAPVQQKTTLQRKLKWAKVDTEDLLTQSALCELMQQHGYRDIQIANLTQQVFSGFSNYIENHANTWSWREKLTLSALKIYLTARLCHDLAQSDLIYYVQVTAQK